MESYTMVVASIMAVVLLAIAWIVPVPYVVSTPGPTRSLLTGGEKQVVTLQGESFPLEKGSIRLVSVRISGGPGHPVQLPAVVKALFTDGAVVAPRASIFPEGVTSDEADQRSQALMTDSKKVAAVVALRAQGIEVPERVKVTAPLNTARPLPSGMKNGDILKAVGDKPVGSIEELAEIAKTLESGKTYPLTYSHDGEDRTTEVTTYTSKSGKVRMGFFIEADFDLPRTVTIDAGGIGGPSAGLVYSLAITELLGQEELITSDVAATGTLNTNGKVGAIGGVALKMLGAQRDGATYFLAPADNCDEVVGHVPDGMTVGAVATYDDAIAALRSIREGRLDALTSCESVVGDSA